MTAALSAALPAEFQRIAVNPITEPFWQAAKEGRLVAPECTDCGTFRMPPTPFCPSCTSKNVTWRELSGEATVFTFAVVHGHPQKRDITLIPAVLDLAGAPGARLVSQLVGFAPDDVHIGMTVHVHFSPISDGWELPVFGPEATTGDAVT